MHGKTSKLTVRRNLKIIKEVCQQENTLVTVESVGYASVFRVKVTMRNQESCYVTVNRSWLRFCVTTHNQQPTLVTFLCNHA